MLIYVLQFFVGLQFCRGEGVYLTKYLGTTPLKTQRKLTVFCEMRNIQKVTVTREKFKVSVVFK